jgi:orotate phosphoribosyltransferase
MEQYQHDFIEFSLKTGVLRFGEFTLKSGRTSPYFFNAGLFNSGASMLQLSRFFAESINNSKLEFDVLFGPAYKGITLSCGTAMALSELTGAEIPYAYNRKEKKTHGEGGVTVGAPLEGKIAIIDDVITAGTAIRESFDLISAVEAKASCVFLALDRQERGQKDGEILPYSAIQQVEDEYDIPVVAIAKMEHLISFLEEKSKTSTEFSAHLPNMLAYRETYGI